MISDTPLYRIKGQKIARESLILKRGGLDISNGRVTLKSSTGWSRRHRLMRLRSPSSRAGLGSRVILLVSEHGGQLRELNHQCSSGLHEFAWSAGGYHVPDD